MIEEKIDRGDDTGVKIIYRPPEDLSDDPAIDTFLATVRKLPAYASAGVDLIDKALSYLDGSNVASALNRTRKVKGVDLGHAVWNDFEEADFIECVAYHGNDLERVELENKTKTMEEIVQHYYITLGLVFHSVSLLNHFPDFDDGKQS